MVRAGVPEKQARLISGHKTRSIFDRYDIVDERDIQAAGQKLERYLDQISQDRKGGGEPNEAATAPPVPTVPLN